MAKNTDLKNGYLCERPILGARDFNTLEQWTNGRQRFKNEFRSVANVGIRKVTQLKGTVDELQVTQTEIYMSGSESDC